MKASNNIKTYEEFDLDRLKGLGSRLKDIIKKRLIDDVEWPTQEIADQTTIVLDQKNFFLLSQQASKYKERELKSQLNSIKQVVKYIETRNPKDRPSMVYWYVSDKKWQSPEGLCYIVLMPFYYFHHIDFYRQNGFGVEVIEKKSIDIVNLYFKVLVKKH